MMPTPIQWIACILLLILRFLLCCKMYASVLYTLLCLCAFCSNFADFHFSFISSVTLVGSQTIAHPLIAVAVGKQ